MNQENFDYLKKQVMYTGFGEGLENELKEKMEKQESSFQIKHVRNFGKDETESTLHFRKSDSADRYFLNSYDVALKQEKANEALTQTFYLGKANNYSLKEAYNLMSGRAVNKELEKLNKVGEGESARFEPNGEKYNAWVQMDFKNTDQNGNYKLKYFHENFKYNLEETLAKYPIKELAIEDQKQDLMKSLQKGNRQSVTFIEDGQERKRFIEAKPEFKTITVYDGNMKRIRQDNKESAGQSTTQESKQKQDVKTDISDETKNGQKKTKRRGQGIS